MSGICINVCFSFHSVMAGYNEADTNEDICYPDVFLFGSCTCCRFKCSVVCGFQSVVVLSRCVLFLLSGPLWLLSFSFV